MDDSKRKDASERLAPAQAVLRRVDVMPVLDGRPAEEILGYGEDGRPERGED